MILHTFNLVIRGIQRSKTTFLINLVGLSVAFTAVLVIYLWVKDEMAVDKFHEKGARLFQIVSNVSKDGIITMREPTPIGLAHVLKNELPEIDLASIVTPFHWFPKIIAGNDHRKFKFEGKFVSSDFFKMFSYPLVAGSVENGLATKQSLLLSETSANKLFGSAQNAISKTVRWELTDIKREGVVSGVFADVPGNSTDQFDIIFSIDMLRDIMGFDVDDMNSFGPHTFVAVAEGANVADVAHKIDQLIKIKRPDLNADSFYLVNYSSRYLYGNFDNGVQQAGRMIYVKIFSLVGLAILTLAVINFINLSTAKNIGAAKEVGIRKVVGASRSSLVLKVIVESILISLLSVCSALLLLALLLPIINLTLQKQLVLPSTLSTLGFAFLAALTIGFVAGIYPALQQSGISTARALRGNISGLSKTSRSRELLIIFQSAVSVLAIFSATVTGEQISYMQSKSLGYDKENIIYFENEGAIAANPNAFISSLKEIPGVVNASSMIGTFAGMSGAPQVLTIDSKQIPMQVCMVNYGLIETMGVQLSAGRAFRNEMNDVDKIVINEKAAIALGFSDPVGKSISFGDRQVEVIGVVRDFHLSSLHRSIAPMIFQLETKHHWNIVARLAQHDQRSTLARIEQHVQKFNADLTFDYRFLEEDLDAQYKAEEQVGLLALIFSTIAIFISILGLISLASFVCRNRTKEVGVRKVVGASNRQIFLFLFSYFFKLSIVSIFLALPVGIYFANEWLTNFAYAIRIEVWMTLLTAGIALLLTFCAVGGFILQTTRINPVSILKAD